MSTPTTFSRQYILVFIAITLAAGGLAFVAEDTTLAFVAAVLGLYVLHLVSMRHVLQGQQDQWQSLRELETLFRDLNRPRESGADRVVAASSGGAGRGELPAVEVGDDPEAEAGNGEEPRPAVDPDDDVPVPRHFALGTVAVIRKVLTPEEVARVLVEQRRRPNLRFGEAALELGLLTEAELESLLLTQQEGLYTPREIREARESLADYKSRQEEALESGAQSS